MNAKPLILDAGKKTRAFEVMDIDITNSARFGTKGLGSTTVTWIKWNADGCFSDTSCVKQTGQKDVCLFKDLLTHWYPHNRVEWGNAPISQPAGTSQIVDDGLLLNTRLGTGIILKRKDFALKVHRALALPTDWLHPTGWRQNREILPDACTLLLLWKFLLNTRIKLL